MVVISDSKIRSAARTARSIQDLAGRAGYDTWNRVGSPTRSRIKKVIGENCYQEIASGSRNHLSKSKWTMPNAGSRRAKSIV